MTDLKFNATYSAEDNKLRLYWLGLNRFDDELLTKIKSYGFKWAPRQALFVAPSWSPKREDLCIELAGEITAEDTTILERAEIKAARLDGYSSKRMRDADAYHKAAQRIAERFECGQPILMGHHSAKRALRDRERIQSASRAASKMAGLSDYWVMRAEGVERHANYKNRDDVRSRRIKTLYKDLRDYQRDINHAHIALKLWVAIGNSEKECADKFKSLSLNLLGSRLKTGESTPIYASDESLYSLVKSEKMTHREAVDLCVKFFEKKINGIQRMRYINHTLNRIAYERSMLPDTPRFEGDVTPVIVQAFARENGAHEPKATVTAQGLSLTSRVPLPLHFSDSSFIELDADGWRDLMQNSGYVVVIKERKKSSSTKASIPLINPSKEEAIKLQAIWNNSKIRFLKEKQNYTEDMINNCFKPAVINEVTQEHYSLNSKGDYSRYNVMELDAQGNRVYSHFRNYEMVTSGEPVCRIRYRGDGGNLNNGVASILHLTDKPSKPLPIDWANSDIEQEEGALV